MNARFETFLVEHCHEAFAETELLFHFGADFNTFRRDFLPEHLKVYGWKAQVKSIHQVPRIPDNTRFGFNLPSDPVRYHEIEAGIKLRIEQKFDGYPNLHEEYTFYFTDKKIVFQFRVPFYDATLRAEHPFLFVRCTGYYFYIQPDFSNLTDVLDSMENKRAAVTAELEASRDHKREERGEKEKERKIPDQRGFYHY